MDISNLHNEEQRYIIKQLLSNSQLEKEQTDVKLAQNLQKRKSFGTLPGSAVF